MDPKVKTCLQALIFSFMYAILFLVLLPVLLKIMDQQNGKILYGVLVAGGLAVALRLRFLSRRL